MRRIPALTQLKRLPHQSLQDTGGKWASAWEPQKVALNDLLFDAVQALASGRSSWGSAPGVRGCLSLGLLCDDCCSLRAPPVLSTAVSARGRSFLWSLRPTSRCLASDHAADWGAAQGPALSHHRRCLVGPGGFGAMKAPQSLVAGPACLVITAGGASDLLKRVGSSQSGAGRVWHEALA